jgi:hypothetical protein
VGVYIPFSFLLLLQGHGVYGAFFVLLCYYWVGGRSAWYITFLVSPFSSSRLLSSGAEHLIPKLGLVFIHSALWERGVAQKAWTKSSIFIFFIPFLFAAAGWSAHWPRALIIIMFSLDTQTGQARRFGLMWASEEWGRGGSGRKEAE